MSLALITDPVFYVCAVPAVILLGIAKSGFGAGLGSLAVPLMALTISVPQAAAILMPLLLVMDLLGMAALRRDLDGSMLKFLVPFGLVGTLVGAWLFHVLSPRLVAGIVGVSTLLFLAQRLLFPPRAEGSVPPRWVGALLSVAAGFTSFVSHAGGPPIQAYMLPMRLPPVRFAATLSFFFFFINLSKWIPYAWLGLIDLPNMLTALVLMPLAPVGVWIGVTVARRIGPRLFYRLLTIGMLLTGCKLVWDGFF